MALRKVVTKEDPILRKKSRPVEKFDEKLCQLLDDMAETMRAAQGVGLAAPQVGILSRFLVMMDPDSKTVYRMINPKREKEWCYGSQSLGQCLGQCSLCGGKPPGAVCQKHHHPLSHPHSLFRKRSPADL